MAPNCDAQMSSVGIFVGCGGFGGFVGCEVEERFRFGGRLLWLPSTWSDGEDEK